MKKILALLCCVAISISVIVLPSACASPEGGVSFTANDLYWVDNRFEECPTTIEAWLYLPTTYTDRGGAVFSNYASLTSVMGLEIHQNGVPRLYVKAADRETTYDYKFSNSDVRADGWTHLAIVYDEPNRALSCYINGALTETKTVTAAIDPDSYAPLFRIGGDQRINNELYFKGKIKSVTVYSDVRSASEISADMTGVNTDDTALMAHYNLESVVNGVISDSKTGKYNVGKGQHWFTEKEPVTDYAYSFCFVGDPQKVVQQESDKLHYIYDWILANKDSKKIQHVFGLGDITHTDTAAEWQLSKDQIGRMDGVVPYSVIRGNHDGSANMNLFLGTDAYVSQFEGFYSADKIENSWRTLRAGETDYLLMTLDFGPSDDVLRWASGVIADHPNHKVIVTTHAYLYRDGTTLDADDVSPPNATGLNHGESNNGDQMWEKLFSKYENIFMIVSGHDIAAEVIRSQAVGDHGNTVTQLMINPQWADAAENAGATGMVTMMYFSEDGRTVEVETYSTVREQYHLSNNQFVIDTQATVEAEPSEPVAPTSLPGGKAYSTTALYGNHFNWTYAKDDQWHGFTKFTPGANTGLMFTIDTTHAVAGTDIMSLYILINSDISVSSTEKTSGWDVHYLSLTPKPAGVSDKTSDWYVTTDGLNWTTLTSAYSGGSAMNLGSDRGVLTVYVPFQNGFFCTTNENVIGAGNSDGDGDSVASNSYLDVLSKSEGFQIDGMRLSSNDTSHAKGMRITDFFIVNDFDPTAGLTMSVTLYDSLSINFYAQIPYGAKETQLTLDGEVLIPTENHADGRRKYVLRGNLPQSISDNHTYRLSYVAVGEDTATVKEGEISILSYLKQILASNEEEHYKTVAQAIINYGKAAQEYLEMTGIPDQDVTETNVDLSSLPGLSGASNSSSQILSATLRLENALSVKIQTTAKRMTAKIGGQSVAVVVARDGYAYLAVNAHLLGETITLTDEWSQACVFSVNYYLCQSENEQNSKLIRAIAAYGEAARECWEKIQ